jgi:hypothetical protein
MSVFVLLDEFHGSLRIISCQLILTGKVVYLCHFFVPLDQWKSRITHQSVRSILEPDRHSVKIDRPHVVRIGYAVVFIKAMLQRQEFFMMTKVPFADH